MSDYMQSIYDPSLMIGSTIYEAIRNNDLAGSVLAALNFIRNDPNWSIDLARLLGINNKNENVSHQYRNEGNLAYSHSKYQAALILYNKALLHAPHSSRAMVLAYSNRSALFLKAMAFSSCIKDIDTCFAMGCPPEIADKLRKRREQAAAHVGLEKSAETACKPPIVQQFFKIENVHSSMPNVSIDLNVTLESGGPKIVAAKDISVGTVLASETPFVSHLDNVNVYFSCYYCQKMAFNLIPCDKCCFALFCNESCKQRSMQEGHNFLCPILALSQTFTDSDTMLYLKAVLKMRAQSQSWEQFVAVLQDDGSARTRNINTLFNSKKLFWQDSDSKHFIVGRMYRNSVIFAIIIHFLDTATSFFPDSSNAKTQAIQVISGTLLNMSLHACMHLNVQIVSIQEKIYIRERPNVSLFSFFGTLKRSCVPNVMSISLNENTVLLTVKPIKKGTEIAISHICHRLLHDETLQKNQNRLFCLLGVICTCATCIGDEIAHRQTLSENQAKLYRELDVAIPTCPSPHDALRAFKNICKTLDVVGEAPLSREYKEVFTKFMKLLLLFIDAASSNRMIDQNVLELP